MAHEHQIGTDPEATANALAGYIRGDVRDGSATPLPAGVRFSEKAPDESLKPPALIAKGIGNCGSIPRAAAPFVDGVTHVGVQRLADANGVIQHHAFLVKDGASIPVDGQGRALGAIPADKIHDECVMRGMNGGAPLDPAFYSKAWLSPIWPAHLRDLSHLVASPAKRAIDQTAYQGGVRRHVPQTPDGERMAAVAHVAGRPVVPPADYAPPPLHERYARRTLDKVAEVEREAMAVVGPASPRMVREFVGGLEKVAIGVHPEGSHLDGDPEIREDHRRCAKDLHDVIRILQGGHGVPADALPILERALSECTHRTAKNDRLVTAVSEVHAMLPGMVPEHITKHLVCDWPEDDDLAFAGALFSTQALFDEDDLDLEGALLQWGVACCSSCAKGHQCDGPSCDPQLGSVMAPAPKGGGGGPSVRANSPLASMSGGGPSDGGHREGGGRHGFSEVLYGSPPRGGWSDGVIGDGGIIGLDFGGGDDDDEEIDVIEEDDDPIVVRRRRGRRIIEEGPDRIVRRRGRTIVEQEPDRVVRRGSQGRPPPSVANAGACPPGMVKGRGGRCVRQPGSAGAAAKTGQRHGTLSVQSNVYTQPSDQAPSVSAGVAPAGEPVIVLPDAAKQGPGGGNTHSWIHVRSMPGRAGTPFDGWVWQEVVTQIKDPGTYGATSDSFRVDSVRGEMIDDPILAGMDRMGMNLYSGGPPRMRRGDAMRLMGGGDEPEPDMLGLTSGLAPFDSDPFLGGKIALPCPTGTCRR